MNESLENMNDKSFDGWAVRIMSKHNRWQYSKAFITWGEAVIEMAKLEEVKEEGTTHAVVQVRENFNQAIDPETGEMTKSLFSEDRKDWNGEPQPSSS